ncbi:MAG: alginate lyase family protein [Bacteroidales bacterium]|nr:alginate lyase family protein [Candidatus Liminaster caballi]
MFSLLTLVVTAAQAFTGDGSFASWQIREADRIAELPLVAVTDKDSTFSGDKHNYESLAIYLWPDPQNPGGPYIVRDGEVNPEYQKYDLPRLRTMAENIDYLKKAYLATGNEKYVRRSKQMLDHWFINKSTRMNPNANYGQVCPGKNNGRGYPGAMSELIDLRKVLDALTCFDDHGLMKRRENKKYKKWFGDLGKWLQTSELGKRIHDQPDNIAVMHDLLLYQISVYTGDKKTCRRIADEFVELRINKHIAEDGSQPEELKRTTAMSYSVYNLEHFAEFFELLESNGDHLYRRNPERIDAGVNFLMQYVGHRDKFPYQQIKNDWESCEKRILKLREKFDAMK